MKERPILFSAPMVRAILDGRKTQTRRIVKPLPPELTADQRSRGQSYGFMPAPAQWNKPRRFIVSGDVQAIREHSPCIANLGIDCPYGAPGDRLWVRETWQAWSHALDTVMPSPISTMGERGASLLYRATSAEPESYRWRTPLHMPRWASRIDLEITGVRIELLHAISEDDAKAEGCEPSVWETWTAYDPHTDGYPAFFSPPTEEDEVDLSTVKHHRTERTAREAFHRLWCDINGSESWASNPWVWVVEFRRVKP